MRTSKHRWVGPWNCRLRDALHLCIAWEAFHCLLTSITARSAVTCSSATSMSRTMRRPTLSAPNARARQWTPCWRASMRRRPRRVSPELTLAGVNCSCRRKAAPSPFVAQTIRTTQPNEQDCKFASVNVSLPPSAPNRSTNDHCLGCVGVVRWAGLACPLSASCAHRRRHPHRARYAPPWYWSAGRRHRTRRRSRAQASSCRHSWSEATSVPTMSARWAAAPD
jgi:hypothetical protein